MYEQSKMFALGLFNLALHHFVCAQNIGQNFYQRKGILSEYARCPYHA